MNCALMFIFRIILSVCLLSPLRSFAQFDKSSKPIVMIDPGHGGNDSGAVGINGTIEKEIVLEIALAILNLNDRKENSEVDFYLTRYSDTLISLRERVKLATALKTELFISLHCNKAKNSKASGIEIYVYNEKRIYSKESILIGFEMEKALSSNIGLKSRGIKFADFQVLRDSAIEFPAILIELGFLSNFDESHYLSNSNNLKFLALTIYQTIINVVKR